MTNNTTAALTLHERNLVARLNDANRPLEPSDRNGILTLIERLTSPRTGMPFQLTDGEKAALDRLTAKACSFPEHIGHGGVGVSRVNYDDLAAVVSISKRALLTSPRAAVLPDVIEAIASQWDACMFAGIGHDIDIGASIRDAYRRLDAAPAAPVAELPEADPADKPKPTLTLTGAQLLEALDLIAPDRSVDQLESEVSFQHGNGHDGEGMYCWMTEYPDEGATKIDGSTVAAQAVAADGAHSGLGWRVREIRNPDGSLMDCFVEAPAEGEMPYALQVLGDDYTGYGDIERKYEHCKMIVAWANRAAVSPATAEATGYCTRSVCGCEGSRIETKQGCYHWRLGAEPAAAESKCTRCGSSTAQACNELGCFYLESGNGEPATADERAAALVPASYAAPLKRAMDLLDRKLGDTDPNIEGMGQEEIEQTYPVFAAMRIIVALHDEASQAAAWELGTRDGKERRKIHARAAVSPATADTTWTAPKQHCQNGGDVCLAGNHDGVCCPEDSCDIDDGTRKNPSVLPIKIPHVHIRPEDEEIGRQYYALGFVDGSRSITDAPQPATADEQRAAFEAEVSEKSGLSCACDVRGRYIDPTVRGMWEARQAERASQAAAPQANAAEESEDAYVIRRLSETLADVAVTLRGDDPVHPDDPLNKIELVKRLAKVLRMEVELYRAQAAAPAAFNCDDCRDTGQVCVGTSGREDDGNALEFERCPSCGYGDEAAAPAEAREPHFIAKLDFGEGLVVVQECTLDDAPSIAIYGSLSQGTPGESAKAEPSPTDPKIARRSVFLTFLDSAHRDRVADALVGVPADAGEAVAMTQAELDAQPDWIKNALPPEGA
ncbi:hypothetical protein [Burkholderia gladioli]|uniref:hypothetical protein n=1 Tax=Burkholderia gladioli TaxID=28095 RepID=UPI00163E9F96|nr:hypothetical protein [Burkholderia gladioli]